MREISKAKYEASSGDVNVTSALTLHVSEHPLPLHHVRRSPHPWKHIREDSDASGLAIAIETSRIDDDDSKGVPVSTILARCDVEETYSDAALGHQAGLSLGDGPDPLPQCLTHSILYTSRG